ncbi:MAG: DUF370 domain-containing protein [Clostridia bacterium]|nr:DUF370 domain-containing protein [Clostridia bacterium]MBQ9506691.1 DUF370 domain-containing protein [Clostridia bacterium]MBR5423735.1 DUF370 domain-containing protein [Clostridia bacterium]
MKLLNVGFGNLVNAQRIVCIVSPESAPIKRIMQQAKDSGKLIDVTQGRKTASVIFTDSEHVILSYLKADRLSQRFSEDREDD